MEAFDDLAEINHLSSITSSSFDGSTSLRYPDSCARRGSSQAGYEHGRGSIQAPDQGKRGCRAKEEGTSRPQRVNDACHRTTHKRFSLSTANSHLTSAPHPPHRAGSDRHGQEVGGVAHPDETHQGSHVRRRRLRGARPDPIVHPHSCARPIDGFRSILLPVHVRERTLRRLQSNHSRATH